MKTLLVLSCLIIISFTASATFETNDFLVFEVDRYTSTEGSAGDAEIKQKFQVPLTAEFMSNFKRVSSQTSMGSEFFCSGGSLANTPGSTQFTWWMHRTADDHWSIRVWGMGFETVKGIPVNSMNPNVTQCMTIKKLEDLDMSYNLSYVNMYDCVNISFGAKYMTAKDIQADGFIPTATVRKAGGYTNHYTNLFNGDIPTNCPIIFRCAFQED
jgi:hypothetical protein